MKVNRKEKGRKLDLKVVDRMMLDLKMYDTADLINTEILQNTKLVISIPEFQRIIRKQESKEAR